MATAVTRRMESLVSSQPRPVRDSMPYPLRSPLLGALLLALLAVPAAAQERGSISGRVRDKKTRHAIPFATVTVVGAQRGALTDSEGQFVVSGVAPGTYEVRVQFLGYTPAATPGVVVAPGRPTVHDFSLEEVVVKQEKVIEVTAERALVEVKQGTTVRSVSAAEIRNLPVLTVSDVLQQQAGISSDAEQIHIDLVTGQSTAGQLNARSVAEVNVATGAYDVRYGNALSGVVEIKLKEGTSHLGGGLTTGAGSYGGRALQIVLSGPLLKEKLTGILDVSSSLFETRFRFIDLPPQGGYSNFGGPLFASSLYAPLHSGYEDSFLGYNFKYGDFFSPSEDNRWAFRYGLTWKPSTRDKWNLSFSKRIAIDQGFSRTFITATGDVGDPAFPWRFAHNIDHANTIFEDNTQTSLEWRRTLSTSSYVNFQLSRYLFAQRTDVQGKNWTQYVQPNDHAAFDSSDVRYNDYFYDTGDDYQWQDRRTATWGLQGSMVNRMKRHEVEFGLEHEFQTVQYVTIEDPWIADPSGLGDSHDLWQVHPWVGDLYVRDRLDYEGFTGNLGVRADYWFLGREAEEAMNDPNNKGITPEARTSFQNTTRSFYGRRYKLKLSPRVIVAHPITERSSFFFNYGQFSQIPSYRYVYSKLHSISSESFPLVGNLNLNPQVSVNYEIGAKNQFTSRTAANLTFFVKDVY
ncbi:MAG: TonB-dependent receptor, partial [Candidatus Eisenbacteria bacterium]